MLSYLAVYDVLIMLWFAFVYLFLTIYKKMNFIDQN